MGGRMTSLAAADGSLSNIRGIIFFGFPLHAAGAPSAERGDHLKSVSVPMLFLQGERDKLADLNLLRPIVQKLNNATLHVVEQADHSFHVPKSSGRSEDEVFENLVQTVSTWIRRVHAELIVQRTPAEKHE